MSVDECVKEKVIENESERNEKEMCVCENKCECE